MCCQSAQSHLCKHALLPDLSRRATSPRGVLPSAPPIKRALAGLTTPLIRGLFSGPGGLRYGMPFSVSYDRCPSSVPTTKARHRPPENLRTPRLLKSACARGASFLHARATARATARALDHFMTGVTRPFPRLLIIFILAVSVLRLRSGLPSRVSK